MDRRQLLKGLAGLTIGHRLVALNEARAAGVRPVPAGLHEQSGKVEINGAPAHLGMAIQPGDSVTTGEGSRAIYVIGRDVHLQRERTVVQIAGDGARDGLRVVSGKLLSVFGKGDKKIMTSTATIGIRGTACYLDVEEHSIYFCLCYGKAEIVPIRHPEASKTIETQYHDHPMQINAYGDQIMSPSTVRNHSDSELMLLEALAARHPPFVGLGLPNY